MRTNALALALCLALGGCAADTYFERGRAWEARDPSAAAEWYALCLSEDPAHAEARARVESFDFYGPLLGEARGHEGRDDWVNALRAYDRLTELAAVLRPMGGRGPEGLTDLRAKAERQAAAQRFAAGEAARAQGDDATAARAFRECLALDPTHAQARAAYKEAHARAVRRVGIVPFEADAPAEKPLARELADATIAKVSARKPEMVELVTRTNLEQVLLEHDLTELALVDPNTAVRSGKLLGLHIIVTGRLSPIERGDSGWAEQPGHADADQPASGGVRKISADWVVRTRTTRAAATLNVQAIVVETGEVLFAERIVRSADDRARYARKTGGEDAALPREVASLCQKSDAPPRSPDDLARDLIPELSQAAAAAVAERLR